MRTYVRTRIGGGTYFFTLAVADRRHGAVLAEHAEPLRDAFRHVRRSHPFTLDAIVVLPDHLHCIWTLPPDDSDYPTRWRLIKSRFSRAVPAGERISPSRARRGERAIWQRRYWEHVIRDERDLHRHFDYIHYNPVKHGHAQAPIDWRLSSFRRFVAQGFYDADWAAEREIVDWDLD